MMISGGVGSGGPINGHQSPLLIGHLQQALDHQKQQQQEETRPSLLQRLMGAVRNQNLPPEEQNFDAMGIHPRKGSIKDSDESKADRSFSFIRRGSSRKKKQQQQLQQQLDEEELTKNGEYELMPLSTTMRHSDIDGIYNYYESGAGGSGGSARQSFSGPVVGGATAGGGAGGGGDNLNHKIMQPDFNPEELDDGELIEMHVSAHKLGLNIFPSTAATTSGGSQSSKHKKHSPGGDVTAAAAVSSLNLMSQFIPIPICPSPTTSSPPQASGTAVAATTPKTPQETGASILMQTFNVSKNDEQHQQAQTLDNPLTQSSKVRRYSMMRVPLFSKSRRLSSTTTKNNNGQQIDNSNNDQASTTFVDSTKLFPSSQLQLSKRKLSPIGELDPVSGSTPTPSPSSTSATPTHTLASPNSLLTVASGANDGDDSNSSVTMKDRKVVGVDGDDSGKVLNHSKEETGVMGAIVQMSTHLHPDSGRGLQGSFRRRRSRSPSVLPPVRRTSSPRGSIISPEELKQAIARGQTASSKDHPTGTTSTITTSSIPAVTTTTASGGGGGKAQHHLQQQQQTCPAAADQQIDEYDENGELMSPQPGGGKMDTDVFADTVHDIVDIVKFETSRKGRVRSKLRTDDYNSPTIPQGLTRHGSNRRHSYRYRGPWRGPGPEDDGPSEPMFHYPHSKQYYVQQQQRMLAGGSDEDDGRRRSHSTSPLDPLSPKMDLDRPSRSPSPHPLDQAKTEYYGTTKLEQRSRSPSPIRQSPQQQESSLPLPQQLRRFPGRIFNGAKRRLLPTTPGSLKKKSKQHQQLQLQQQQQQIPGPLQLGKIDQSLVINFPLVSHSPTIPTRTPAVINFPKLNASPTHQYYPPGTMVVPLPGAMEQQQMMQLPPPLLPQPGIWLGSGQPGGGDPSLQMYQQQQQPIVPIGTEAAYSQQQQRQQQQQQQQSTSRFAPVGASLSSLFAPLFGGSRQQQQPPPPPQQTQTQLLQQQAPTAMQDPNVMVQGAMLPSTAAVVGAPSTVLKRNPLLPGESLRQLPQPPQQQLQQQYSQTMTSSVTHPKPISEIQKSSYHQSSFPEGILLPSAVESSIGSGSGGGTGRMLPSKPGGPSGPGAGSIMMHSMDFAKAARERMKIRSSTWNDETYVSTGPRRRQPIIPAHIKRPSSAGMLTSPTDHQHHLHSKRPFVALSQQQPQPYFQFQGQSSSTSRRITPPVPRAQQQRRRAPPLHQHSQQYSFHSDGATEVLRGPDDDDDDDDDWC